MEGDVKKYNKYAAKFHKIAANTKVMKSPMKWIWESVLITINYRTLIPDLIEGL